MKFFLKSLLTLALVSSALSLHAQTFDGQDKTLPATVRPFIPGVCVTGQMVVRGDQLPGQNLYICGQANNWGQVGRVNSGATVLTDAATITTDASLANAFRVTLGGNRTLGAPTNATDGQRVTWEFIQDATGTRTLTLNAAFAFGTDITAATLTTTASKRDFLTAVYNATTNKWYVVAFVKGY